MAVLQQFANFSRSTLASSLSSGGTSLTVNSASTFPAAGNFTVVVDPNTSSAEIMTVTAVSGTTFTVTRGQEGTSAVSHNSGATIAHVGTAALLQRLYDITYDPVVATDPNYGVIPDARRVSDIAAASTSSGVITSAAGAQFTQADVGKICDIYDFVHSNYVARCAIASVQSATQATLASNVSATVTAGNATCYIGTNNFTALQAALTAAGNLLDSTTINANQPLGVGRMKVYIPTDPRGSGVLFGSGSANDVSLNVPTNVTLDADAMLISAVGLADNNTDGLANRTWAIYFQPGACVDHLEMDCCYTMGCNMGVIGQQNGAYIDYLKQWSVGGNYSSTLFCQGATVVTGGTSGFAVNDTITLTGGTFTQAVILKVTSVNGSGQVTGVSINNAGTYTVAPTNPVSKGSTSGSGVGTPTFNLTFSTNSQIGLQVQGNDLRILTHWSKGANIGLYYNQNNDTMADHLFEIGCATGWQISFCEEIQCANSQFDTCNYSGIQIDGTHNFRAKGNMFSINSTSLTAGIMVGQNGSGNSNLNMEYSFNRTGGDAVRMGYVNDSWFNLTITNNALFGGGGVAITNGINFTGGPPSGTIVINAIIDPNVTNQTAGTLYGSLFLNTNQPHTVVVPTTGFSNTIPNTVNNYVLNPAGTLATGTIKMCANPTDSYVQSISTSQAISSLTLSANTGQTIKNAPTSLAAGAGVRYIYDLATTTWFRQQ